MLYTKFGRIVAGSALILGILEFVFGVMSAAGVIPHQSDQLIDRGGSTVLFAIALGILTEISHNVRANKGTGLASETPSLAPR